MIFSKNSQTPNELTSIWTLVFKNSPPLGHVLRYHLAENWLRFHALPNSKQYADTNKERDIILARANALAGECFGHDKNIWMIDEWYGENDIANNDLIIGEGMKYAFSWIDEDEEIEDQHQRDFFAKRLAWRPTALDQFFIGAANEDFLPVFLAPSSKTVLHHMTVGLIS